LLQRAVAANLEELWSAGLTDGDVIRDVGGSVRPVVEWLHGQRQSMAGRTPTSGTFPQRSGGVIRPAPIIGSGGDACHGDGRMQVDGVEVSLFSHYLGIKGQLDAVIYVGGLTGQAQSYGGDDTATFTFPLEIKTGKWRSQSAVSHRAQVILYVLMLHLRERSLVSRLLDSNSIAKKVTASRFSNKYTIGRRPSPQRVCSSVPRGSATLHRRGGLCPVRLGSALVARDHSPGHGAERTGHWNLRIDRDGSEPAGAEHLLSGRISITVFVFSHAQVSSKLPSLLRNKSECENCYQAAECLLTHAAAEGGSGERSGAPELWAHLLTDLSATHLAYVRHWDRLLALEGAAERVKRPRKKWVPVGSGRGERIASVMGFQPADLPLALDDNGPYLVTFRKLHNGLNTGATEPREDESAGEDMKESTLVSGDRVVISLETRVARSELEISDTRTVTDIEDIDVRQDGRDVALAQLEPSVASGTVLAASFSEITVSFSAYPRRLEK